MIALLLYFHYPLLMATTPDLPPGARFRMWALFIVTAVVGIAMYQVFERYEGLFVAAGVLFILVYLLTGVRLTLIQDQAEVGPLVDRCLLDIEEPFWLLVDGKQGTVLHVTDLGSEALCHSVDILQGQRFTDLTLEVSLQAQAVITELLRFGCASVPWSGVLEIKAEDGAVLALEAKTIHVHNDEARKAGFVVIAPQA